MAQRESDLSYPSLVPLTPEARTAASDGNIPVLALPFRMGRDLRNGPHSPFRLFRKERRRSGETGPNHVYLAEQSRPHRVSRQHILIDQEGGRFYVQDQRSACGTLVEGEELGGQREGGRRWLKHGDVIIVGGNHSPFVFKFLGPNGSGE
jgi:pSer/pThr/pTyr-binding forkhead associated (FHA) protein